MSFIHFDQEWLDLEADARRHRVAWWHSQRKLLNKQMVLHREFVQQQRLLFRLCDVMIVLILVFALGAAFLTNALVMREPTVVLQEVNPVVAQQQGYMVHPEAARVFQIFVNTASVWFLLLVSYLAVRLTTRSWLGLGFLLGLVLLLGTLTGIDFVTDAGFAVGHVVFRVIPT